MNQSVSERFWQAKARTEETKRLIQDIKRITRRKFTAEEKIRIVLEGSRRGIPHSRPLPEGRHPAQHLLCLVKDFMEAGKERLTRDTARDATKGEVQELKRENAA